MPLSERAKELLDTWEPDPPGFRDLCQGYDLTRLDQAVLSKNYDQILHVLEEEDSQFQLTQESLSRVLPTIFHACSKCGLLTKSYSKFKHSTCTSTIPHALGNDLEAKKQTWVEAPTFSEAKKKLGKPPPPLKHWWCKPTKN